MAYKVLTKLRNLIENKQEKIGFNDNEEETSLTGYRTKLIPAKVVAYVNIDKIADEGVYYDRMVELIKIKDISIQFGLVICNKVHILKNMSNQVH